MGTHGCSLVVVVWQRDKRISKHRKQGDWGHGADRQLS